MGAERGKLPLWQGSFLLTLHLIAEETKVPRCAQLNLLQGQQGKNMYPKVGNLAYTSPQLVKVAYMHAKHHKAVAERTTYFFHTSSCLYAQCNCFLLNQPQVHTSMHKWTSSLPVAAC